MTLRLQELFDWYKTDRKWNKLSLNSKITYDQMMKSALDEFYFQDKVSYINQKTVDAWYEKLNKTGKKSKANQIMKVMRLIWNLAKKKGFGGITDNPFESMGLGSTDPRMFIWSKEQVNTFIKKAYELNKPHIAILVELCYNLGQRPGDMIALKIAAYNEKDSSVTFKQEKTGKIMFLPIMEPLKSKLNRLKTNPVNIRNGTFLPKMHYSMYNREFRAVRDAIGMSKDIQLRDIRRTVQVELMEGGATDAEGLAVLGDSTRELLNTYAPSTLTMTRHAMEKRGFK